MFEQLYRKNVQSVFVCSRFASGRGVIWGSNTPECDLIRFLFSIWCRHDVTISFNFHSILSGRLLTILGGELFVWKIKWKPARKLRNHSNLSLLSILYKSTHTLQILYTPTGNPLHKYLFIVSFFQLMNCKCQAVYRFVWLANESLIMLHCTFGNTVPCKKLWKL